MSAEVSQVGQAEATYIADYDLPDDNRRRRFYRAVQRYLRDNHAEDTGWSSQSVVFTKELKFARLIYDEALKVGGKASIWRGTRIA